MNALETRTYVATTGREYSLELQPDHDDAPFWTYNYLTDDGLRYGPSTGFLCNRHATPELAIERIEQEERIRVATDVPATLSRTEYERACERADLAPMSDRECDSYGVHYGVYALPEYPVETIIRMDLANRRLRGIEAERAARPAPPRPEPEMVRCACGHSCQRNLVISASRGTSCPDCYDRMSD